MSLSDSKMSIDNASLRRAIRRCDLFSHLPKDSLETLLAQVRILNVKAKVRLISQGQHASEFFLVFTGELKLAVSSPMGHEKILCILNSGDTFAEALMFLEAPNYPVSVTAISPSLVVAFPNQLYKSILVKHPDAYFGILGRYSQRIRQLVGEIESLTTRNATYRVVGYLLQEIPSHRSNAASVELRTPKHAIASRLSITPETLSRILSKLKRDGAIKVSEKHITLCDIAWMKKFVSES